VPPKKSFRMSIITTLLANNGMQLDSYSRLGRFALLLLMKFLKGTG